MSDRLHELIQGVLPEIVAFRRDLHAHPELSRQEHETSRKVRARLATVAGVDVREPLMETDVVAVLNGDRKGRCIALRADLDALPITEATGVEYQSQNPGVMHACGHDGHTAVLLGTAMVLAELAKESPDDLPGKVKFIFQPDEEDIGGAKVLCERGVLQNPAVDAAVALHGWPGGTLGTIAYSRGAASAANLPIDIRIRGKGAHGAYPHRGVDAIVVAAHVVTALQTVVSRTIDPLESGVVTIGSIDAGAARNVVAEECRMSGTIRYLRPETGEHIRQRVEQIIHHTAAAHGAAADVELVPGYPPVVNDRAVEDLVGEAASESRLCDFVISDLPPSLGVEDFAFYAQRVPACIFRVALRPEGQDTYPDLHNAHFDFNDDAIPVCIEMLVRVVLKYLQQESKA